MREILNALRMIPAAGRYLGGMLLSLFLVWYFCRLLKIPSPYNWIMLAGVVVAFALFYLVGILRKRKQKSEAKKFEQNLGLQSRQAGVGKEEIREALAELSQRWEEAAKEFREAGLSVYDLPWYLLIGEPQSGKSTTIQNSGLEFPVGTSALSGSGGTRNCDWWFTNEAVILDTAGRFTFQEADAPDQHEWNAFLKLLRRHRKQCPINGVIVVIPVTSLVEDPVDVIESKAKNIRQKLLSLQKMLGIRFPIFVLVTKTDRILGFTEFFSRLDPIDQRQIVGWSSKSTQPTPWDPKAFDGVFDEIFSRVHKLRLKYFHAEDDTSKLDKLFVFPEELAATREPLALYLTTIFAGSRYEEPLMLRGFYLTSGVQQGRPFARACKELLRVRAGDPEGILENLEQVFSKSRAFFIRDFYEKKVFPEQGLVAKTREAVRQEKIRRRILFGGVGLAAVILIPLLIWAFTSLRSTVGATTQNARKADTCLQGEEPCSAREAYDLIQALERNKTDLQRKWLARWLFLKGRNNPVIISYIPAAQAALFSEKIIGPLQMTFENRARSLDWLDSQELYLTFRDAFEQQLRFHELGDPNVEPERRAELRERLSIEPLLTFCAKTQGGDRDEGGEVIDLWLSTDYAAPADADRLFRSVLEQFPKVADDHPPLSIRDSREAMLRFWTIASLAGWDSRILQTHFEEGFLGFLRRVDELNAATAPDREATLRGFSEHAAAFEQSWRDAEELMRGGRPVAGSAEESPGASPDQWRAFCLKDFGRVRDISGSVYDIRDVTDRCDVIPDDYLELEQSWRRYDYLFKGSADADEEADRGLVWSEAAVAVYNAVVDLLKGVEPTAAAAERSELESTLSQGLGIRPQLDAINTARQEETSRLIAPVRDLQRLEPPALQEAGRILLPVAELGVAARLLPPVRDLFVETVFDYGNETLYTADRARDNVPKANEFLVWAQTDLREVSGQPTTEAEIRAIDDAIYGYVEELVEREMASMGGGGGGSYYVRPRDAENAQTWRGFVDAVSRWNHVGTRASRSGGSSIGVDAGLLADFAQQNDRLAALSRRLRDAASRSRRSSGQTGPVVEQSVERAINDFKDVVSRLDADALEAWRQLADRPENLTKFHAFSRLGRGSDVDSLRVGLEQHGSRLLTTEIAPEFQRAYEDFWGDVEDVGFGYFPFVTARQLEDARTLYARGYVRTQSSSTTVDRRDRRRDRDSASPAWSTGEASWRDRVVDTAQRMETIVLSLPTVDRRDAEDLFEELTDLTERFALGPILAGSEAQIDFVGTAKSTLLVLRQWGDYLDAAGGGRRRSQEEFFGARLLPQLRHGDGTFLLERVNSIKLFDAERPIRSSTEQYVEVPFYLGEEPLTVVGENEDRTSGWQGRLVIEGGFLKLPYFVLLAADGAPADDRRTWDTRIEIPAFNQPESRVDGIFELSFDRPIPGVLPDTAGREYD